jgi:hypothetical protein
MDSRRMDSQHTTACFASTSALAAAFIVVCSAVALCGCTLDGLLIQELTRNDHQLMPPPAAVIVTGRVPTLPGAQIWLLGAGGPLVAKPLSAAKDGAFRIALDGTTELVNSLIEATSGGRQLLGVVPMLPRQKSVLDPELTLDTAQLSPGMQNIDVVSTTLALLALTRAKLDKRALTAIPHGSMTDTLIDLHAKLGAPAGDHPAPIGAFGAVQRVVAAGAKTSIAPFISFNPGSLLNPAFVSATGVDADNDGAADTSTGPFDKLLSAAAATFKFKACYVENKIKVVIMARLATAPKNRNCDTIDPFLWAIDKPSKRMMITGGVHKTTPVCTAAVTSECVTAKQVDALNATLGNWVPNKVAMHDDGSNGDGVAGDGVWTIAFDAPWWPVPDKGRGVRLGYKFTWGNDGAQWGGTEEFPGNMRILELNDRNDDRVITRLDHFADEASNKDKANQLAPSKGGCGKLHWPDETPTEGCETDVWERETDLDGDCKVDGWPNSGSSAPLTVQCLGE